MQHSLPKTGSIGILISLACSAAQAQTAAPFVALPESSSIVSIVEGDEPFAELTFQAWGKAWSYTKFHGTVTAENGGSVLSNTATVKDSKAEVNLVARFQQAGARQLTMGVDLRTDRDTDLTFIVATVGLRAKRFEKGRIIATYADGSVKEVPQPIEKRGLGNGVKHIAWMDEAGAPGLSIALDPPCDVASDGALRIVLAGATLRAATPANVALTLDFPRDVSYLANAEAIPSEAGFENWFEFQPGTNYEQASEIGMQDWIEAPAGKHGRITRRNDQLLSNGKPVKVWGLNLCYGACAPTPELADKQARFYRMYGINAVRLHKYAESGVMSKDSHVVFDPAGLDRMDYFIAQLKQQGIYVEFSAQFGAPPLGPADRAYVPYLDEFGAFSSRKGGGRIVPPHSSVPYSPELQTVQILHMTNLMRHKNPYTGLTYAEDPAVAFVEMLNEQSILFYSSMLPLKASATLRATAGKQFCAWLRWKYGTQAKLDEAWGGTPAFDCFANEGFPPVGEQLDRDNILPLGNPWFWDPVQLCGTQAFRRQRLLDSMVFLAELQNQFHDRYTKAMREAGYEGELIGSNWQAGRAYSHFLNLYGDALVGTVDRHNYYGGGGSTRIQASTMLRTPGSGLLSSGMQQVSDRPFMLSEWIHVTPNEWGVEGPAILGAYGLGLQGWDASFMFQNRDRGAFSKSIGQAKWDVTAPNIMGIFPAVARQVLRGDVTESTVVAPRYVHVPSLGAGKLPFDDQVRQSGDEKAFGNDKVPSMALAVARCPVEFTDTYRDVAAFDLSPYFKDGWYVASTGELRWRPGAKKLDGCFTLNSAGTKCVVGFAQGQAYELGTVTIEPKCRFAAIYVTAKEPDKSLETSRNLLVVAIARARNTGMKVFNDDTIIAPGKGPVVMEPVKATISFRKGGTPTVTLLDHSGRKTAKTLPVSNGAFEIDGARDKTCYYLVSYPEAVSP